MKIRSHSERKLPISAQLGHHSPTSALCRDMVGSQASRAKRRDRGTPLSGVCLLLAAMALLTAFAAPLFAQDAMNLGFADYQNILQSDGTTVTAETTLFYQGHVGPYAVPDSGDALTTPTNGAINLAMSALGQPVGGRVFFSPDCLIGEEVTPPDSVALPLDHIPIIDPPTHAFYVETSNKVYAGDFGLVNITWRHKDDGSSVTQEYLVSDRPIQPPVNVYRNTDLTTGTTGYLVDLSGAPTPTIHYNSAIPTSKSLWLDIDSMLHAQNYSANDLGLVVMHYDDGTSFSGIEILDVRALKPEFTSSTYAGSYLAPGTKPADMLPTPSICRGQEATPGPYIYQYGSDKDPSLQNRALSVRPTSGPEQILAFWKQPGKYPGVEWPYELTAYTVTWDPATDWQRIYYTAESTLAPTVKCPTLDVAQFFYNDDISSPDTLFLYDVAREIRATDAGGLNETGGILLRMDDFGSPNASDLEFIEVHPYSPDAVIHLEIGQQALPTRTVADALPGETFLKRGWNGVQGDISNYAYQHGMPGNYKGAVFATKPNTQAANMEAFYKRQGKKQLIWPYEMHRYTADWPTTNTQILVRGSSQEFPGPKIAIPKELYAFTMPFQEYISPAGDRSATPHADSVQNNEFFSNLSDKPEGDYYSLLRYQTGPEGTPGSEWVGFRVIKSVQNTDARYFDLTPNDWDIGTEITDPSLLPGLIYHLSTDNWDKYDPTIYAGIEGYSTGQILPVAPGALEVWWSEITTHGLATNYFPIQWQNNVKRYDSQWPASPETIVIASETGSGQIPSVHIHPEIYYQNDPAQIGYNPNYEHARLFPLDSGLAAFALRCDLNAQSTDKPNPYMLLKYIDTTDANLWRMRVFSVQATDATHTFDISAVAGSPFRKPYPLAALPEVPETLGDRNGSYGFSGNYWLDRNGMHWASAAADNGGPSQAVMRYWYPVLEEFVFPNSTDNTNYHTLQRAPWLDGLVTPGGNPVNVTYTVTWPSDIPVLKTGESLVVQKFGLPNIIDQSSVEIIYESLNHSIPYVHNPSDCNVKLIDPLRERHVDLESLPTGTDAIATENIGGKIYFVNLPPHLRERIYYDPMSLKLVIEGQFHKLVGEDLLLLNVLTQRDIAFLKGLGAPPDQQNGDADFLGAIDDLFTTASAPVILTAQDSNSSGKAVVGITAYNNGLTNMPYVTLAMQNHELSAPQPISLEIIRIDDDLYKGELKVIEPASPFDEKLTLRHTGDFAGGADTYTFKWDYHPDMDGIQPAEDDPLWTAYQSEPMSGAGALDITIRGATIFTISDNWFRCRYRRTSDPDEDQYYSTLTPPQLAPGWIKRVMGNIDPFTQRASGGGIQGAEQRFSAYQTREVNTIVSMIGQAGPRWEGNIPMNAGSGLDNLGLIEIYDTVLGRGKELSVDAGFRYPPANNALLLAAGRIADLYVLLGNEAYADAADPTIAFGTADGTYGYEASSIHCFMNQTSSLLEEELALLRGRDDQKAPGVQIAPLYNRLIWNFTNDIVGGEVAYALNYNIQDALGNADGTISELDAMKLYPQGHGDAWGHYLTATKRYYSLLRHPNFDWVPRAEAVLVAGQPVTVDYLDERKFAKAAAAKARTGSEIVNLSYRAAYVEDPEGQWQGYKDEDSDRAWGLSEWGSRAGQGAYFDWVAANAILPDRDDAHTGIQKVDRTTVAELREITAALEQIQQQLDMADIGLNPLGLAKNVVPFDIDPAFLEVGSGIQAEGHFEQIYGRAMMALNNAVTVFNHATNCTQILRSQADSQSEFQHNVTDQEADFSGRLIEVFGYPYEDDIGDGKLYPKGYDGPDIYHYMYVDASEILGRHPEKIETFTVDYINYNPVTATGDISNTTKTQTVTYHMERDGFGMVKPPDWGSRRAPGEIQMARSAIIQSYGELQKTREEYSALIADINDLADLIDERVKARDWKIGIVSARGTSLVALDGLRVVAKGVEILATRVSGGLIQAASASKDLLPTSLIFGLANGGDATAPVRGGIKVGALVASAITTVVTDLAILTQEGLETAKIGVEQAADLSLLITEEAYAFQEMLHELKALVRQEKAKRLEIFNVAEAASAAIGEYQASLASGLRLLEDRTRFRTQTAGSVQDYRYKDMAFRIFRNDALQKYRSQFDLAARYVYLAAKAYDYETNLLAKDRRAGEQLLTSIIRARSLGTVLDGEAQTGSGLGDPGLADTMARMKLNWDLSIKGQLGINNPQIETNRFSMRRELFRTVDDATWREVLRRHRVDNILDFPDFKRYCRSFYPQQEVEPAIVIPFSSTINFGFNFFGDELAAGDSAYDSTNFATKINSAGVWFSNYDSLTDQGLSNTPRVYLIPTGFDIMRTPSSDSGEIRIWKILDQKIPSPFPVGQLELSDPKWIPRIDTLSEEYADIRKFSSFRAYHDSGEFDPTETATDTRIVGRSVWNTRWMLIIPAGTLHSDREHAMETFINGVTDIKIYFMTYAYSGN